MEYPKNNKYFAHVAGSLEQIIVAGYFLCIIHPTKQEFWLVPRDKTSGDRYYH